MRMELSLVNWLLAISPVLVLLFCILVLKWEAAKSGAMAWFAAIVVALTCFGAGAQLLALASSKGISLSLYVLLIIWGAVFLYNIANEAGAIKMIGSVMTKVTDDKLYQCLLLAWCFTSVLQGLAGFGVPIAVVAPIMVVMGFEPLTAVSACLIGITYDKMQYSFMRRADGYKGTWNFLYDIEVKVIC